MKKILFIRLSALGDVINTLPAVSLARKRFPEARIGFVVEDRARDVVVGHPDVDRVFVFERARWSCGIRRVGSFFCVLREIARYILSLRREKFEIALDVQGNAKGAVHAVLSGARMRVGFSRGHGKELNHLFSTIRVTPSYPVHRAEKFASLLRPLGIRTLNGAATKIPSSPESEDRIRRFLSERLGMKPFVTIHPGTSEHGRGKRWPIERYAEVGKKIADELKHAVVITWGPQEQELAQRTCDLMEGRGILSMKTESLLDLAELVKHARVFISADTGPMHLAAACGTPCVAIFGPKDPVIYRPYGSNHRVLKKGDRTEDVTVPEVFEAVKELVKGTASR